MPAQPYADFAPYQFNIRSFHPEKTFGWSGLGFEGDNRRFSLAPSGRNVVTSRIWHRFTLRPETASLSDIFTRSDVSRAPSGFGGVAVDYSDERLYPQSWQAIEASKSAGGLSRIKVLGGYSGANHAMFGSEEMQKKLGVTYVPLLHVNYKLWVDLDRANRHVDVTLYVSGDGFPNCEAFLTGPKGQAVSLGVFVRRNAALLALPMNPDRAMIACAIRLPLNRDGSFRGLVGDELARRERGSSELEFVSIADRNSRLLSTSPNDGRCMALEQFTLSNLRKIECSPISRSRFAVE